MRISRIFLCLFLLTTVILFSVSCRKSDKTDTSPGLTLAFSTDTVFFDTVFPTVGSVTQRLLVYNRNKNKVSVSTIRLAGGTNSNYRINVNGTPATSASNIEIPGEDSIFIFVKVTVDPHNENTPYVVSDSIEFTTNGSYQNVKLVAWGREAEFYREATLKGNIIWDSLRAHVIYGSLRIDTNSFLTILPGTRVFFHKDAWMAVSYGSTMKINGTIDHPVRFQGDRMDPFYKDLPGQWNGIYLEQGSKDHEIDYAIIRNGTLGIAVDSLGSPSSYMLNINNSIIENMTNFGIYAEGTSISSVNCLLADCGSRCFAAHFGGDYDFRYLTIANYWYTSVRHNSSVYLSNYRYDTAGAKQPNALVKALFTNSIVYGINDEEIEYDTVPSAAFNCTFDHAILKTNHKTTNPLRYINCLVNKDPRFVDPSKLDYRIDSISPAIGAGKVIGGIPFDILGHERGTTPALGAYEYVKIR